MVNLINILLDAKLQEQLIDRLWRDDRAKMPHHLYPHQSQAELYDLWRRDYEALRFVPASLPAEVAALFAPATPADLRPRYLADPAGSWYALTTLRYNRRTKHRFCYARYWWAADAAALQELVRAVLMAWQEVPFDWFKLRLGYGSSLRPDDLHPRAARQCYVVAGRPRRETIRRRLARLELGNFRIEKPHRVEPAWWGQYQAMLAEQEDLVSKAPEAWDYQAKRAELRQEMAHLLGQGGQVINLFEDQELVGHISYGPDSYWEQLIQRCWHINNVIVRASHRRRGLGQALHNLAADSMNLITTPIVAGLIASSNTNSLRTAAKMGRRIVDDYVIVPKA